MSETSEPDACSTSGLTYRGALEDWLLGSPIWVDLSLFTLSEGRPRRLGMDCETEVDASEAFFGGRPRLLYWSEKDALLEDDTLARLCGADSFDFDRRPCGRAAGATTL